MYIQITARHMVGGRRHEHIAKVRYREVESGEPGEATRQDVVNYLDAHDTNNAVVGNYPNGAYVYVGTAHPANAPAYIRTYANGQWNDNLLALPEY